MKKATKLSVLTFLIAILSITFSNAQNRTNMYYSGDFNSFGAESMTFVSGPNHWIVTIEAPSTDTESNFLFRDSNANFDNKWSRGDAITFGSENTAFYSGGDTRFNATGGKFYTFILTDVSVSNNGTLSVQETTSSPVTISSSEVSLRTSTSFNVGITLSGSKPSEQEIYVRYTTDNFTTSKHVKATGSGTSYSATIPEEENTIYYILTTTVDLGSDNTTFSGNYDNVTINLENNSGSNYTYTYGFSTNLTGSEGYRLLSSPTIDSFEDILAPIWTQGAAGADVSTGDKNVFEWNNISTGQSFSGLGNLTANVTAGVGYLVYVYADDDFDGTNDAFPKTLSASGTENAVDISPSLSGGTNSLYYLVGNPFATTIDFDNVSKTDLTDVAYVWDPNSGSGDGGTDANGGGGSWKTWNGTTGDLSGGLITPFQGFFIQGNTVGFPNPAITFGSASKSTGGTFLGKTSNTISHLRLNVEGNEVSNSAWLQVSDAGSAFEKVKGDANELNPLSTSYAQLAFQKGNELLDIAHVDAKDEFTLPIEFNTTKGGEFTINASNFTIPSDVEVTFHDYQEGVSMIIDESFSYKFEAQKLKARDIQPLSIIRTEVFQAKASDNNRFGITVTPTTSVNNELDDKATKFALDQNYPNPFNPTTTINYSVENAGEVNISIYNLMGQKVAELVNGNKAAGSYNVTWNASGVSSGMYYYRLEAGGQSITRKMTLIK